MAIPPQRPARPEAGPADPDLRAIDMLADRKVVDSLFDRFQRQLISSFHRRAFGRLPGIDAQHRNPFLDEREHRNLVADTAFEESGAAIILDHAWQGTLCLCRSKQNPIMTIRIALRDSHCLNACPAACIGICDGWAPSVGAGGPDETRG